MTKVSIAGKALLEAVNWTAKGLNKNTAVEHSLITGVIKGNQLRLSAQSSDSAFDVTVNVTRPDADRSDTTFVVEGAGLKQVATHLKNEDIALTITKNSVVANGTRAHFEIDTVVAANIVRDFPTVSVGSVLSGALREAVNGVSATVAAPTEPVEVLRSIKVEFHPEKSLIRLVACDRYQLMYREVEYVPAAGSTGIDSIIIPGAALKNLVANVPDTIQMDILYEEGNIFLGLTSSEVNGYVKSGTGEYIPYEKMFTNPGKNSFTCNATEMQSAVQTVSSMRANATDAIVIEVEPTVAIVRTTDKKNSMEVDVNADGSTVLSFDPRYVMNALRSATAEEVRWTYSAENAKSAIFESLSGVNKTVDESIKFLAASKKV